MDKDDSSSDESFKTYRVFPGYQDSVNLDATRSRSSYDESDHVLEPVGFPFPFQGINEKFSVQESSSSSDKINGYVFDINNLKDFITNQEKTTKIRPVLISFSGLSESGKSMAVKHFLNNYVEECPLTPITPTRRTRIPFYKLIAAGLNPLRDLSITEVTHESSLAAGILSAFKNDFMSTGKIPLFSLETTKPTQKFRSRDLDDHLQFIYRYLCEQKSIPKGPNLEAKEKNYGEKLKRVLPAGGVALINIWDLAINETVGQFLTALRGHFYNHHSWLFIDLEKDLDHLNEPPIQRKTKGISDGTVFMKWRPSLHYMLRSCQVMKSFSQEKQRKNVCTIFAKHEKLKNGELQEKVEKLEEKVKPAAKHIGVSSLLEDKIQTICLGNSDDTDDSSRRLYQKFQQVIFETPFEEIPLSWVFLRSLFYQFEKKVISRKDLKKMAMKCGINENSFEGFCKFYTSFASIFDLSLINPDYAYVIVKPIHFIMSLDGFLCPNEALCNDYPTIKLGIVPEEAFKKKFGVDWPAYVDALVSLNFATKVTSASLDIPVDRSEMYYYITSCRSRTAPLISKPDLDSVHVITSIDTPSVFKRVTLTKHLLDSLPNFKLVPCENMNQTIIKNDSTTLTIVSHSPGTRLHFSRPNLEVCSRVVEAYRDIARSCNVATKYKFIMTCAKDTVRQVQFIPSSHYHILPDDRLCDKCREAGKTESELLKMWNEVLKNERPPTSEGLKLKDLSDIAEELQFCNAKDIAKVFEVSYDELKQTDTNDSKMMHILMSWREMHKNSPEPKRLLAQKLPEISSLEPGKIQEMAEKLYPYFQLF